MRGGLAYPPQPCGLPYKEFKSGWAFKDAYEHVAWGRGDGPRTITQRTVLREMAKLKKAEYQRYQDDCVAGPGDGDDEGTYAEEGDTSFDFSGLGKQKSFSFMKKEKFSRRRRAARPDVPKQCTMQGSLRTCEYATQPGNPKAPIVRTSLTWIDRASGRPVAWFELDADDASTSRCAWRVAGAHISPVFLSRGLGTRLYEASAAYAQSKGCVLVSDKTRSVFSEAFWRKQERKGRAKCGGRSGGNVYTAPANDLREECARHMVPKSICDSVLNEKRWPKPDHGMWPCRNWVLNYPPPDSLAGMRARRKRKR